MSKELQVILDEQNVPAENAKALIEAFGAPFTEAGDILRTYEDIKVTDESQVKEMAEAKEKRLALKRIRTGVESKRKELKEDSLRTGRAIDIVARYIKENIEPAEKYLESQEKFAELKKAAQDAKTKADRIERLLKYTDDISLYNLDNIDDETFEFLLAKVKKEYDDRVAAEKAEADRIEKERLAEIERQKAIEAENAKLKAEAEAREIAVAKINMRINQLARLGLVWDERSAKYAMDDLEIDHEVVHNVNDEDTYAKQFKSIRDIVTERTEELKRQQAEKEEAIEKEREKERVAAETERKRREEIEEADRKRIAAEAAERSQNEEAERRALLAPDKEKLKNFANGLDIVRKEKMPALKTKQAQEVLNQVDLKLSQLFSYINDEAEKL